MELIEEAHRNQDQANSKVQAVRMQIVEIEELRIDITASAVLEFEFRVEHPLIIEFITHVEDGPQRIEDIILATIMTKPNFAIAPDRKPFVFPIDLRGRRSHSPDRIECVGRRHDGRRDRIAQFGRQGLDPGFQLGDALIRSGVRRIGFRGCRDPRAEKTSE